MARMVSIHVEGTFTGTLDELEQAVEQGSVDLASLAMADVSAQALAAARRGSADAIALADAAALLARLIERKAAALLPNLPPPEEPAPDEPEPAALGRLIEEYRLFRAAAEEFRGREQDGLRSFPRLAPPPIMPLPTGLGNLSLDRLLGAVTEALARRPPDPVEAVPRYTVTVRERLEAMQRELAGAGRFNFSGYIRSCRSRIEIIVGFMAVLELIKDGRAHAEQPEPFGDIVVVAGSLEITG